MRAILSILMIVSLALQAMFGCCRLGGWHCAHDADETVACSSADCLGDHQAKVAGGTAGEPCHCKVECAGLCNYLPSAKVLVEPHTEEASFVLAIVPDRSASQLNRVASLNRWEHSGGESLAPLRLHLLNQVLLI
jgi:hypothetical protein